MIGCMRRTHESGYAQSPAGPPSPGSPDVFMLPAHRGRGLGRFVVESLLEHPSLQGLRRIMLATKDAHELYRSYGFTDLDDPGRFMMRRKA